MEFWGVIDKVYLIIWFIIGIGLVLGIGAILCLFAGCVIHDKIDERQAKLEKDKMGKTDN